jgi:hypothetical protein
MRFWSTGIGLLSGLFCGALMAEEAPSQCLGKVMPQWQNMSSVWKMPEGFAVYAKMNVNIDGYGRAYHRQNYQTDAVIHLCNAGEVVLPDGSSYDGSESNATCTGKFMSDLAKIEAAGWTDPHVGAVRWYGVLGTGNTTIHGRKVVGVIPVKQGDNSGYYVSPTALFDASIHDPAQQERYVNPLTIPAAVIPARLVSQGIGLGSFGVAYSPKTNVAVPFVVGDLGPRVGEGTPALARQLAGLPLTDSITRKNRYAGQVDTPSVLWVFFGGDASKYDHADPDATITAAKQAFERWGGMPRLQDCKQRMASQ